MTVKTIQNCNMCGIDGSTAVSLQGLLFDTQDRLNAVAPDKSPMHICPRCKEAVHALVEYEINSVE